MYWNRFPLLKLVLPFLAGVVFSDLFPFKGFHLGFIVCFFTISLLLVNYIRIKTLYHYRYLFGLLVIPAFFFAGTAMRIVKEESFTVAADLNCKTDTVGVYVLRLTEIPQQKSKSWKFFAQIQAVAVDSLRTTPACGILIYLAFDSLLPPPAYGDLIIAEGMLKTINPPKNPGEFDYQTFLRRKGIFYQMYIKQDGYKLLKADEGNRIISIAGKARHYLMSQLEKNGLAGDEYAVASAILLGYDDLLDPEQRKAYSGSGAMHVLCVSGLHVGVIYLVITLLLSKIAFLRKRKWLNAIIIFLIIWIYAIITGLSPSVLRASAMFSFVVIGGSLGRKTHIINSLAASAFFLMLIQPLIIFEVGFQLSYLAVIGIVFIQPFFSGLYNPANKILNYLWGLVSVSIAAQVATFPLATLYFHQFPNYFLLTNILVIPMSAAILYSGLASFIFMGVPYINTIVVWLLGISVKLMNLSVGFIEALPGAVTRDVFMNAQLCLMLYILFISLFAWLIFMRKHLVWVTSAFAVIMLVSSIQRQSGIITQKQLCIYSNSSSTSIEFSYAKSSIFLSDSIMCSDPNRQSFLCSGYRVLHGITDVKSVLMDTGSISLPLLRKTQHLINFSGYRLAVINKSCAEFNTDQSFKTNALLISDNPYLSLPELLHQYKPEVVLIAANNYPKNVNKWSLQLDSLGQKYHDINKGAFIVSIP